MNAIEGAPVFVPDTVPMVTVGMVKSVDQVLETTVLVLPEESVARTSTVVTSPLTKPDSVWEVAPPEQAPQTPALIRHSTEATADPESVQENAIASEALVLHPLIAVEIVQVGFTRSVLQLRETAVLTLPELSVALTAKVEEEPLVKPEKVCEVAPPEQAPQAPPLIWHCTEAMPESASVQEKFTVSEALERQPLIAVEMVQVGLTKSVCQAVEELTSTVLYLP